MAQAVSRWPLTAESWFAPRSVRVGFMVDKVGVGQAFIEILGLPCQHHSTVALHTDILPRG
jgi:hypothetical protein